MKNNLYTIYNKLSMRYGDVFTSPTDATAVRSFNNGLKDNAGDYELCRIGNIEIETGVIETEAPVRVQTITQAKTEIEEIEKNLKN